MPKQIIYGFLLSLISACSQANTLELKGKIRLKGPAIHAYLVIEDEASNTSYKIINDSFHQLIKKQNQTCLLVAKFMSKPIGPRFPAAVQVLSVKACK